MMLDDARRQVAHAGFKKAEGDLIAARRCAEAPDVPGRVIGFHCQQAVEKAMKGMLVVLGREPPRTHDVTRLSELIEDEKGLCPISAEELDALSSFAVDDRYPMMSAPEVTRSDAIALIVPAEVAVGRLEQIVS